MNNLFARLRSESPVMWVSWGELIGMTIALVLIVLGVIVVLLGACTILIGVNPRLFYDGMALLIVGLIVSEVTQEFAIRVARSHMSK